FPAEQEEILFLVPYTQGSRRGSARKRNKNLFELYLGARGRITVPAEGAGAIFEALRRLAAVALLDPASQTAALQGLLDSENPALLEAALDEIERMRAVSEPLYPRLIHLLQGPSPGLRIRSLRLVALLFLQPPATAQDGDPLGNAREALAATLERARNDGDETVRAEAVVALAAWPERAEVEGDLRAIAESDPAQAVRYEAQRALLERTQGH
ncbi:MAG TPA: hypothetical protein VFT43_15025, partial [Candidatus Polarisedimenticolia bacterium]|nr:hypothetical protein [Candidatus Polarisedimenticolia bacterium]